MHHCASDTTALYDNKRPPQPSVACAVTRATDKLRLEDAAAITRYVHERATSTARVSTAPTQRPVTHRLSELLEKSRLSRHRREHTALSERLPAETTRWA
jgi:hypothetical protein